MGARDAPKLRRVRRLDSIRLDENDRTYFTKEGYLVDHPILTSVGIFEYTNPDGSTRRELRLPEYVFDEKSLETYRGKPVIITHGAGVVDKRNVHREQIGTILSSGYQDGEDVRAEIIIHNTDAMKRCGLKELSLGYNLDLLEEPGEWNGQSYDAIQTNIVINHLALVASARAGEQARLNIDGSDEPELKGGKCSMNKKNANADSIDMTPEELLEAVKAYRAAHAGNEADPAPASDSLPDDKEGGAAAPTAMAAAAKAAAPAASTDPAAEVKAKDGSFQPVIEALRNLLSVLEGCPTAATGAGDEQMADDGENPTLAAKEPEKGRKEDNRDGSGDQSRSLNADSADDLFRQRLGICRIGDRLHLDGLENKSILEGKMAIIGKVLPDLRLDGKNEAYINAAYDLAVAESGKRKDVSYQRKQMTSGAKRNDGVDGSTSMAASARQRMIDREGGKA